MTVTLTDYAEELLPAALAQRPGLAPAEVVETGLEALVEMDPPAPARTVTPAEAVANILELGKGITLGGLQIRDLNNEGRKYRWPVSSPTLLRESRKRESRKTGRVHTAAEEGSFVVWRRGTAPFALGDAPVVLRRGGHAGDRGAARSSPDRRNCSRARSLATEVMNGLIVAMRRNRIDPERVARFRAGFGSAADPHRATSLSGRLE